MPSTATAIHPVPNKMAIRGRLDEDVQQGVVIPEGEVFAQLQRKCLPELELLMSWKSSKFTR